MTKIVGFIGTSPFKRWMFTTEREIDGKHQSVWMQGEVEYITLLKEKVCQ
ncbi:hypothetical protein [Leifsonia sp. NPDC080035]|uniref:Uncharacterized protein n=1 Tax=Leifsonia sp. NPDC080035 TaxID=3143936 RepID=A0AAU7GJ93_9MICO